MVKDKYYVYDKKDNALLKVYYSNNLIQQYEYHVLTGKDKGLIGYSTSFADLVERGDFIVGKLKALKILYAKN